MLRIIVSVLVWLGTSAPALAQYHFDSWTTEHGLPQNSVNAILQSRDGYLWLTTWDGLVRFDGIRFTTFNRANSPGIRTNRFTVLYEDRDGVLWIGTENAGVTRYERGRFETFAISAGRVAGHVRGITGDESGRLWILMDDEVVEWVTGGPDAALAQTAPLRRAVAPGFPTNIYTARNAVQRGLAGSFYSATPHHLALFARGAVSTWTRNEGLTSAEIYDVAVDAAGTVWASGSQGVIRIETGRVDRVDPVPECIAGEFTRFVKSVEVTLACRSRDGNLLLIAYPSKVRTSLGAARTGLRSSLLDVVFYRDREHNLWIGTDADGLYRVRKRVVTTYSTEHGLRDRNVYPVYQDRSGAIWLGAWPSTVSRLQDGQVTNYSRQDGLSGEQTTSLYQDRDGRLWVGAYGGNNGLRIFRDGRFIVPPGLTDLGVVMAMIQDRHGAMWFGTDDRLVRFLDGQTTAYTTKEGLADNSVLVLLEGANGDLWIAGHGGLTRLHDGTFTAFRERDGLPSNYVRSLYEDADGVLWIGTYDSGLARLADGTFTRYTTEHGLFDNGVFQILEDDRGYFWTSSNRGISRVSRRELNELAAGRRRSVTAVSYGKSDGMRTSEANGGSPAGVKARDGTLWFPTQDGVVTIDPASLGESVEPPATRIESCRVDRAPVSCDGPVRLGPGNIDFELDYTALTFVNSDRVRFRYKLEGLDEDWIDAGTRRTAHYSRVPPGSYDFRVIAASSEGVWDSNGSRLAFVVLPPFYRTWWFLTILVTSAGGTIALVWRRREAQLRSAHAAQQAFSRQLIASQEAERKRIAAELHDSLGQRLVIIKNLAMLVNSATTDGIRDRVDEISSEASLAIGEVREIAQNLRPHHLDRLGLTKALESLVRKAAGASTIRFTSAVDPLDGVFPREAEINVYRVVQESVNNVLRHSEATEATVTVTRTPSRVRLVVHDNGRGFAAARADGQEQRVGFGLTGVAERVTLLGGRADVRSAPGQGTTISITFDVEDRRRVH